MPLTMLIWPLPALLTWALAWGVFLGLRVAGLGAVAAFVLALLVSGLPAWTGRTPWRRVFMLAGFPLSLLASGAAAGLPAWAWLLPLAPLLALSPPHTPRGESPQARIHGLEWSWPLTALCALRCRFAQVRRADIWAANWSGYDLVYLFQRPESMPRAMDKAASELRPGSWLVSLEFEAGGWAPQGVLQNVDGKPVWLYQAPFRRR